jgi:predicted  nucleic acid-binding Zn-ribbon protein
VANVEIIQKQAALEREVTRLKQERFDLEAKAALLDRQVRDLMDQNEKLTWIAQDIDQRIIAIQEGRKPWEDVSGK